MVNRMTNLLKLIIFLIVILNTRHSFINCEDETNQNEVAEEKDDIANRIYDIFSEESGTEVLDEKSIGLANSFDNFNEEILRIYRTELDNLKKNPNDVYRKKMPGQNALEQNSDPIFYNWFAFSLTAKKIIISLTHSLSSKFLEYSDISLTPKCMLSMLITLDELKQQRRWAVKMLDSTGKPGLNSILEGSIISLGGYDQCLAIKSPRLLKSKPAEIHGKYCLVKYDIPLPKRPANIGIRYQLFNYTNTKMEGSAIEDFSSFAHALYEHKPRLGFCIPSQCQVDDLQLLLNLYFKDSTTTAHVDYCYSEVDYPEPDSIFKKILNKIGIPTEEMNNLQKAIISVYFAVILFVIFGTAIDLYVDSIEHKEIIQINKLSEHNLKTISNWNRQNRSTDGGFNQLSLSRYYGAPITPGINTGVLPTPSTGEYNDSSPFFRSANDLHLDKFGNNRNNFEMKNLDAEAKRRLFRRNASVNTVNTINTLNQSVPPTPTPDLNDLAKFTVSDSVKLFNFWRISKKNKLLRTFTAFSVHKNGNRLFQLSSNTNDALDSLHGIRVISMLWIILTHTYLLPIKSTMVNSRKFLHVSESYFFQFIVNGWVLVDSFFFVGALLLTYNQLRTLNRTKGRINLFRIMLSRLIRISPSLWFIISFIFVLPVFVRGPLMHEYLKDQLQYCRDGWFLNVLFINNWFPYEKICMLHTWYLSADLQMYFASLFVILVLFKYPKIGCCISIAGIISSIVGTFLFTYFYDHPPTVVFNTPIEKLTLDNAAEIYTITLPHIAPYSLGILAGYSLFKSRTYKINAYLVFVTWVTMIALALTILMWTQSWNRGGPWTPIHSALYASWHRFAWSLVLFWVTFSCSTKHGGFINSFLSWTFFKFLSKLSFPCFLVHFVIIWGRLSYSRNTLGFSHYTMVCEYIVNVAFSLLAAVILHLCIELPSINLYNILVQGNFEIFTIKINKNEFESKNNKEESKETQTHRNQSNQSSFWFF